MRRSWVLSFSIHGLALACGSLWLKSVAPPDQRGGREYELTLFEQDVAQEPFAAAEREMLEAPIEPTEVDLPQLVELEPAYEAASFPQSELAPDAPPEAFLRELTRRRLAQPAPPSEELVLVAALESEPSRVDTPSPDDWVPAEPNEAPPGTPARVLENAAPEYPRVSRRLGEEGSVVLEIGVDARGRATSARVIESSGFERLDQAAVQAVLGWRFQPATQAGVAIDATLVHTVTFRLQ